MALKFQKLQVSGVIRETGDAITIRFHNPDPALYTYIPGQYLTLKVEIDGKKYNRAYSLCSSPVLDDYLAVTVKKVSDGIVSRHLNANLKEGDLLDVLPPLGNFTAKIDPAVPKHFVLIGAGSGITPLMSILRTALAATDNSHVTLIFGNRSEDAIIFRSMLEGLSQQYEGRLKVVHSLTQPGAAWTGLTGRLTRGKVKEILQQLGLASTGSGIPNEYFVCGPSAMMDEALHALRELNVPAERVHQEHFSAPITHPMDETESTGVPAAAPAAAATDDDGTVKEREVTVVLEGKEHVLTVTPNQSVLEAALDADLDPPYACMIGSCCTCKAKLLSGKVVMDDREGLTDDEIKEGFVLTCQSHPTTAGVVLSYDEL